MRESSAISLEPQFRHRTREITPVQQMISSCSGAILTSLLVTPLDVVKIRLQAQKKPFREGQRFLYRNGLMDHVLVCLTGSNKTCPWYRKTAHFKLRGTVDALVKIARYEGITSLWSGLPPTLLMAVPATVIYFTSYEQVKLFLDHQPGNTDDWWKPMASGALARVWAVSLISPLELVRTKLQSEQMSYNQVGQALKNSIKQEGILSLWRGLGPTIYRDVPFSAMYWFGYESMKSLIIQKTGSEKMTFSENFSAGAISGTIAAVVTLPFDVIKTHRQIEIGQANSSSETSPSKGNGKLKLTSTWALIKRLYAQEGISSLFTGLVPRVVKIAPACAIMISSYEYFKHFFQTMNEENSSHLNIDR